MQSQTESADFAEPTINTGGARFKRWRLSEKEPLPPIRILPSMKSLVAKQAYCDYWNQHFIVGVRPDDPTKPKYFPVLGIEVAEWNYGQKTVVEEDPLVKLRQPYVDRVNRIRAAGKEAKASKEEIKAQTKADDEFLKNHGYDGKWRFYGVDRDGNFGVLELNNTTKKNLLKMAEQFKADKGYNPFGRDKGVFWVFRREGKTFPITDTISVLTTSVTVGGEQFDKVETHQLTDAVGKAALSILPDFEQEKERIHYSRDVLEQLAACGDDPKAITAILTAAKPQQNRQAAAPVVEEDLGDETVEDAGTTTTVSSVGQSGGITAAQVNTTPAVVVKTQPVETPVEDDEEAVAMKALAEARAKKAAKAKAAEVKSESTKVDPTSAAVDLDAIFGKK